MYRNVFVLVIFAISTASMTLTSTYEQHVDPNEVKCANEVGVTMDFMHNEMRNISESDMSNPKVKCLFLCMWKTLGLVGQDGRMNMTKVTSEFKEGSLPNRENIILAFTECSKQRDDDPCQSVSKIVVCMFHQEAFRKLKPAGIHF